MGARSDEWSHSTEIWYVIFLLTVIYLFIFYLKKINLLHDAIQGASFVVGHAVPVTYYLKIMT